MAFWTILCLLLTGVYVALMTVYGYGWVRLRTFVRPAGLRPARSVTVVVAARNEAKNITACLDAIVQCDYPSDLWELLVVDDHSVDHTAQVVLSWIKQRQDKNEAMRIRLLSLQGAAQGKKAALETAVASASADLILITDADCLVPPDWIAVFAALFENEEVKMATGPVLLYGERNAFERFQALDFVGLMGITGAGIHLGFQRMGNGASLGFRLSAFREVGGYAGSRQYASGDDMFLLQKVEKKWPGSVLFLKSKQAVVQTRPMPGGGSFFRQRLRWGSKNAALPEWPIRLALLSVWLFCWSIVINLFYNFIQCFQRPEMLDFGALFIVQVMMKALSDYFFLRTTCSYFDKKALLRHFWKSFILHTLYIPLIGMASLLQKRFLWKGRKVG